VGRSCLATTLASRSDLGGLGRSKDAFDAAQTESVGVCESRGGRSRQAVIDKRVDLRSAESIGKAPGLTRSWADLRPLLPQGT
jgi:hypothetical protein